LLCCEINTPSQNRVPDAGVLRLDARRPRLSTTKHESCFSVPAVFSPSHTSPFAFCCRSFGVLLCVYAPSPLEAASCGVLITPARWCAALLPILLACGGGLEILEGSDRGSAGFSGGTIPLILLLRLSNYCLLLHLCLTLLLWFLSLLRITVEEEINHHIPLLLPADLCTLRSTSRANNQ